MDPFEFALAVATAVAGYLGWSPPVEVPAPPPAAVVEDSTYSGVITDPFQLEWDDDAPTGSTTVEIDGETFSLGWIVSTKTGNLVCVTAAPCEHDAHYSGPEDSSWNWITQEEN